MRGTTLLITILAGSIGLGVFLLENRVRGLKSELNSLQQLIFSERETIRVLEAEWSHLNDPTRLRTMATQLLGMKPVSPNQLTLNTEKLRSEDRASVSDKER